MFSVAASVTSPRPVSPPPDSSSTSSLASQLAGVSTAAGTSPAFPFERLFQEMPHVMEKQFSNRELVRLSGVSRSMNAVICNKLLPSKVFGKDATRYKEVLGDGFSSFVKNEAQFCNSFPDTEFSTKRVPYDPTRHSLYEIRPMHTQNFYRIKSQRGESRAEANGNLITITHGGKTHPIRLDHPIDDPIHKMGLSPDGRTCAVLAEDEAGGGGQARLYIWRLDGAGRETIRYVPMEGPLINVGDVTVTDNGAVCLRSMPAEGRGGMLHYWQPGTGLRSVLLPFHFHHIAAVAPNGTRLLLDGLREKTPCVFLIDLNPADPKRQYDYCILKTIAPQMYSHRSHACFSPDSEVLAMDEMFDDSAATGKWTMLFVNVGEVVPNGGEISLNNPAVARRSPVITARSGYYVFTYPSFLSDGMTVVKTLPSRNSKDRYAQEVHFPFAHKTAIGKRFDLSAANAPALPPEGSAIISPVKPR